MFDAHDLRLPRRPCYHARLPLLLLCHSGTQRSAGGALAARRIRGSHVWSTILQAARSATVEILGLEPLQQHIPKPSAVLQREAASFAYPDRHPRTAMSGLREMSSTGP
jgi:hypothetical protein